MRYNLQFEQWVPFPLDRVFLFFANPGNLPRIMPAATRTELLHVKLVPPAGVEEPKATVTDQQPIAGAGSELVTSFRVIPFLAFRARWIARITEFEWNHHFADEQKQGPFRHFHHRHEFQSQMRDGINGTLVRDRIEYEVGFGMLGELANRIFIRRELEGIFRYRQSALKHLLH